MRILLIEDDRVVSSFIIHTLREKGFAVDHVNDGKEGYELARVNEDSYSAIILDIMLPHIDGLSICHKLREEGNKTPILMLSGRDLTKDKVDGLNAGADDYLTKPFEISELIARINAVIRRRRSKTKANILEVRHVRIDNESHEVYVNGEVATLTHLEYRLLNLLMLNKGRLVTRSEIIEKVWDLHGGELFSNSVNVHIKELRKKISEDKNNPLILTIRGSGYKFSAK